MSASERVKALIAGARCLADAAHPLGRRARGELPGVTGLSAQGVERALLDCLETQPTDAEIASLIASAGVATRAHVLLSANVFIAAHRAIALALAASEQVCVRASRREPVFAQLLNEAAPGLFTLVSELKPQAGEVMWAYGSDQTLTEIQAQLPQGVQLHAQGSGLGVVVVREEDLGAPEWTTFVDAVALDTALFDQRGCLSPRLILAQGSAEFASRLQSELLAALQRIEVTLPRGHLLPEEQADLTWYRECVRSLGDWSEVATGAVARVEERTEPIPPPGRNLQICHVADLVATLKDVTSQITCVAHPANAPAPWKSALRSTVPHARHCLAGQMQRPPFDGPADLR
jgi:hypothetical protein